jgi:hypothetical protein
MRAHKLSVQKWLIELGATLPVSCMSAMTQATLKTKLKISLLNYLR